MEKLSNQLILTLRKVEYEISRHIEDNKFYLEFKNKCWASCPQGQDLMALTILAVNLRYEIETIKNKVCDLEGW